MPNQTINAKITKPKDNPVHLIQLLSFASSSGITYSIAVIVGTLPSFLSLSAFFIDSRIYDIVIII